MIGSQGFQQHMPCRPRHKGHDHPLLGLQAHHVTESDKNQAHAQSFK